MGQATQTFDLRRARLNAGHTVRSLAAVLDMDARTLARLEAGEPIHPAKALRVAKFFDVQVTDLMPVVDDDTKAAAA